MFSLKHKVFIAVQPCGAHLVVARHGRATEPSAKDSCAVCPELERYRAGTGPGVQSETHSVHSPFRSSLARPALIDSPVIKEDQQRVGWH